jgi:hypothetical protein
MINALGLPPPFESVVACRPSGISRCVSLVITRPGGLVLRRAILLCSRFHKHWALTQGTNFAMASFLA